MSLYPRGMICVAALAGSLALAGGALALSSVALAQEDCPRGALDKRWLWNPTGHHARLTEPERRRVMPWFYAGAVGWSVSIVGCVLAGLAVVSGR